MAKLGLVFVLVVQAFYPVMCAPAFLALRTLLSVRKLAKLRGIDRIIPPLVLDRVEVKAAFVVVRDASPRTFLALEFAQVQMPH